MDLMLQLKRQNYELVFFKCFIAFFTSTLHTINSSILSVDFNEFQ